VYRNNKPRTKFHSVVGMIKQGCHDCTGEKEHSIEGKELPILLPSYSAT